MSSPEIDNSSLQCERFSIPEGLGIILDKMTQALEGTYNGENFEYRVKRTNDMVLLSEKNKGGNQISMGMTNNLKIIVMHVYYMGRNGGMYDGLVSYSPHREEGPYIEVIDGNNGSSSNDEIIVAAVSYFASNL